MASTVGGVTAVVLVVFVLDVADGVSVVNAGGGVSVVDAGGSVVDAGGGVSVEEDELVDCSVEDDEGVCSVVDAGGEAGSDGDVMSATKNPIGKLNIWSFDKIAVDDTRNESNAEASISESLF